VAPGPGRSAPGPWRRQDRNKCEIAAANPGKIATSVRPGHSRPGTANRQLTAVAILGSPTTTGSHLSRSSTASHHAGVGTGPATLAPMPGPGSVAPGPGRSAPGPWRCQDRDKCEMAAADPSKIATSVRPGHSRPGTADRQLTAVAILGPATTTGSHLSRSSLPMAAAPGMWVDSLSGQDPKSWSRPTDGRRGSPKRREVPHETNANSRR